MIEMTAHLPGAVEGYPQAFVSPTGGFKVLNATLRGNRAFLIGGAPVVNEAMRANYQSHRQEELGIAEEWVQDHMAMVENPGYLDVLVDEDWTTHLIFSAHEVVGRLAGTGDIDLNSHHSSLVTYIIQCMRICQAASEARATSVVYPPPPPGVINSPDAQDGSIYTFFRIGCRTSDSLTTLISYPRLWHDDKYSDAQVAYIGYLGYNGVYTSNRMWTVENPGVATESTLNKQLRLALASLSDYTLLISGSNGFKNSIVPTDVSWLSRRNRVAELFGVIATEVVVSKRIPGGYSVLGANRWYNMTGAVDYAVLKIPASSTPLIFEPQLVRGINCAVAEVPASNYAYCISLYEMARRALPLNTTESNNEEALTYLAEHPEAKMYVFGFSSPLIHTEALRNTDVWDLAVKAEFDLWNYVPDANYPATTMKTYDNKAKAKSGAYGFSIMTAGAVNTDSTKVWQHAGAGILVGTEVNGSVETVAYDVATLSGDGLSRVIYILTDLLVNRTPAADQDLQMLTGYSYANLSAYVVEDPTLALSTDSYSFLPQHVLVDDLMTESSATRAVSRALICSAMTTTSAIERWCEGAIKSLHVL